jgi:DNA processing protein
VSAPDRETAAVVALVRNGRRPSHEYAELIEQQEQTPSALLERELSEGEGGQTNLLAGDPEELIERAAADLTAWERGGTRVMTVLDSAYPANLRAVFDRPALIFVNGNLEPEDERSIAIIGTRRPSAEGLQRAEGVTSELAKTGYTIVSGLAKGIDTAAHQTAIEHGGRTIAVIGTGLNHAYPAENAGLQNEIANRHGVVVSQFWPDTAPSRETFPRRNALMSGLTQATVIIEASDRSGTRIQARRALAHGRPVFLTRELLGQAWASELAGQPGVSAFDHAAEIDRALKRRTADNALTR